MATDTNSAPLTTLAQAIIREAGKRDAPPRAMLGDAFCHQAALPASTTASGGGSSSIERGRSRVNASTMPMP